MPPSPLISIFNKSIRLYTDLLRVHSHWPGMSVWMKATTLFLLVHWRKQQVTRWFTASKCHWPGMNVNMNRLVVEIPTDQDPLLPSLRTLHSPCTPSPNIFLVIPVPIHHQPPSHLVIITFHLSLSTRNLSYTSPPYHLPLRQMFYSLDPFSSLIDSYVIKVTNPNNSLWLGI